MPRFVEHSGAGEPASVWADASPVIIQRRAKAVRRGRLQAGLLRFAILFATDCLFLFFAYSVLRFGGLASSRALGAWVFPAGIFPFIQVLCAITLGLLLLGNYRVGPNRRSGARILAGSTTGWSLLFWPALWHGASVPAVAGFVVILVACAAILFVGRALIGVAVSRVRKPQLTQSRALVIGSRWRYKTVSDSAAVAQESDIKLVGFVPPDRHVDDAALGQFSDLVRILDRHSVDTLILGEQLEDDLLADIVEVADRVGCSVLLASTLFPVGGFVPEVVTRGIIPYVQLSRPSLGRNQLLIKRVSDILGATLLLTLLSPVIVLVALLVKLTSPGPMVFKQKRVGYGGRLFKIYKFRSMVQNADVKKEALRGQSVYRDRRLFKVKDDPRITRFGRFIRKWSLDELPQLWNVVIGDMSLVGPRPPLAEEVIHYEEHHYSRFDMKPGITGPWQVAGRNDITNFDEIISLDVAYLSGWSLVKDIAILAKTVPAVLSRKGAA